MLAGRSVIRTVMTSTTGRKSVAIVGGHGKVALKLAKILAPNHAVTSLIRDSSHATAIEETGASPLLLSLEESRVDQLTRAFDGKDVVYFSAGAGGKGGAERTKAVDYDGAIKVFDAIEAIQGEKPRLILVSGIGVRNPDNVEQWPSHYNDEDKKTAANMFKAIGTYAKYKWMADRELSKRTAFKWTIIRPGHLSDEPGTGKIFIGKTHLTPAIARDDVASVLALLADRPNAHGLVLDMIGGGQRSLQEELDAAIQSGGGELLDG